MSLLIVIRSLLAAFLLLAALADSGAAAVRSLKEIREQGVIIQQWDTSCAAAVMATVLTFTFGDPVSERAVAQAMLKQTEPLKVRHRGGFSLLDMKRYAEERGYEATGFKGLLFEDLVLFQAPIVAINMYGYNHYVVFRGMEGPGRVWLADPAYGNRTMSRARFEKHWIDGLAFIVTPEKVNE